MSPYQFFRLARLLLLVLLATVFLLLARGRPVSRRLRLLVLALLAVAALGFVNFGFFHPGRGHVHYWDAFHYFMGAKYLPELGYTRLYEATYVAGRELGAFDYVTHLRDLETYTLRDAISIDRSAVRSRFRPERWEAFKRDLTYWGPHINEWRGLLQDHGYNDPPPRALLLHLLLREVPANAVVVTALSSLDYLLLAAAFVAVRWGFGELPAALAGAFFFLSSLARFDFIGGSILRWDWIAALLAGLSLYARGRGIAAGALLGYAVLARTDDPAGARRPSPWSGPTGARPTATPRTRSAPSGWPWPPRVQASRSWSSPPIDGGPGDGRRLGHRDRGARRGRGHRVRRCRHAPRGTVGFNPAFDVTPARLVDAVATECGVAEPRTGSDLRALERGRAPRRV